VTDHLRWIVRFWRGYRKYLPLLFALNVLAVVAGVGYPLVFREVMDYAKTLTVGAWDRLPGMHEFIWILLAVGLARSLRNLYPMMRARVNCLIEMSIRRVYFSEVLTKSHRFFLKFRTGDIVTRLTDDISGWLKISWFMCSGIFRAVESATVLVVCVGVMLWVDWRLGLLALSPLPVMMLLIGLLQSRLGERMKRNQAAISRTNDLLESGYSGIRIVKAYRSEERQMALLQDLLEERVEVEMGLVRMWSFLESLFQAMTHLGRILTIGFGGVWVIDGSISIGDFFVIYMYVDLLSRPLWDIPHMFTAGKQAFICMDRLEEMTGFEPGFVDGAGGDGPVGRISRVDLEEVSFRFGNEDPRAAVSRVSLSVLRGSTVAVMGPVGSGKTTLARILTGELRPTSGRVTVNGTDLGDLDLTEYRRRVGYIPQEALLFSDTVKENVAFGREAGEAEVEQVLRLAQMDEEVAAFPNGLDELLGQRGVRVSGGQRQRLAVARALVTGPDLVVMDDVTAALDAENEEALWDAVERRHPDLTAVVVTHRVATARRADTILVLDRGRVVDRGTHEELISRCSLYRRLAGRDEPSG
jgi:ATP-binding cassette subfamily B protein